MGLVYGQRLGCIGVRVLILLRLRFGHKPVSPLGRKLDPKGLFFNMSFFLRKLIYRWFANVAMGIRVVLVMQLCASAP